MKAYEISPFGGLAQTGVTLLELHHMEAAEKCFQVLNPQFSKPLEGCLPETYRRTRKSKNEDGYPEFSYVLRGSVLAFYHYGRWIFESTPEQAGDWLKVLSNLASYANTYLYDEERMRYDMERWDFMFQEIQKGGFQPEQRVRLTLEKDGCDFTSGRESLSLRAGGHSVLRFTMSESTYGWMVFVELPFGSVRLLSRLCSESFAFDTLCLICRSIPPERFVNLGWTINLYTRLKSRLERSIITLKKAEKILRELRADWFLAETACSVEELFKHLMEETTPASDRK